MRPCDDDKSVIYLLLLLVRHGQNNYFFGRTKLEKILYVLGKTAVNDAFYSILSLSFISGLDIYLNSSGVSVNNN